MSRGRLKNGQQMIEKQQQLRAREGRGRAARAPGMLPATAALMPMLAAVRHPSPCPPLPVPSPSDPRAPPLPSAPLLLSGLLLLESRLSGRVALMVARCGSRRNRWRGALRPRRTCSSSWWMVRALPAPFCCSQLTVPARDDRCWRRLRVQRRGVQQRRPGRGLDEDAEHEQGRHARCQARQLLCPHPHGLPLSPHPHARRGVGSQTG